jgi:tRNA-splicing ligase RtcB
LRGGQRDFRCLYSIPCLYSWRRGGMAEIEMDQIDEFLWEIPATGRMRVPGRIYADERLIRAGQEDRSVTQVAHVAELPGIVGYSLAMPDIHWGYGFPIGGVAATRVDGGVISPGGVGYDINCGVRLVATALGEQEVRERIRTIVQSLYRRVPAGVGSSGGIEKLSEKDLRDVLRRGSRWAVDRGYGSEEDLEKTEERGTMGGADPEKVSPRAIKRGLAQLGTLGSGNHFLEVGVVDEVYEPHVAGALGLEQGQVTLLIHTGSRGFGYQVCDDSLKVMLQVVRKYGIELPDRQLACAPLESREGKDYLAAMACAANYAWANRQIIMVLARKALAEAMQSSDAALRLRLVYDVSHNIAKMEEHTWKGETVKLCVHRKGATRAFPQGHPHVPSPYREVGQPVLIPGDMGRASFVCLGTERAMEETFGSTSHGAGRVLSRSQAKKAARGRSVAQELLDQGVEVMARERATLTEEMPEAYKDVERVVNVMHAAGISRKVVRLRPIGVVKG